MRWIPSALALSSLFFLFLPAGCGDDGGTSDTGAADARPRDGAADATPDTGGGGDAGCVMASARCDPGDTCCGDLVCREASSGDGYCVEAADTCFVAAEDGCCLDDADCMGESTCYGAECRTMGDGVCKPPPAAGECWGDGDCPSGMTCMDAMICPCLGSCIEPDQPGTCA